MLDQFSGYRLGFTGILNMAIARSSYFIVFGDRQTSFLIENEQFIEVQESKHHTKWYSACLTDVVLEERKTA